MPEAELGPILQALQPFLQSSGVVGVLFILLFWYQSRKPAQSAEDREEARWDLAKMTSLRQENDGLRKQLQEFDEASQLRLHLAEADRDFGWNLARGWNTKAHDLWHNLANALQMIPSERLELVPPERRPKAPELLPGLEELPGVAPYAFPGRYNRPPPPA